LLGSPEDLDMTIDSRESVDRLTSRVGAVLLPLGVVVFVAATAVFHPSREHPMDNVAVFMEYAEDDSWVATHFVQWLAALFLTAGFVPVYFSIAAQTGKGVVAARFGIMAAILTAAGFTTLQAVDGIALKWAVDAWAAAAEPDRGALFAAALSVRWTEYALQSYSNLLLGLTVILFALATTWSSVYPGWLAWLAAGSGIAWIIHGTMVAYIGLFDSVPRLIAIVLMAIWAFAMGHLMWRMERG
jgi:hypothetical protein